MRRLVPFFAALVFAAASPPASAEDDANPPAQPAPTKDEAAAQTVKQIKAQASKMPDAEAKAAIAKLLEIWKDKEVADATKKPIPDILQTFGRGDKAQIAAIDALAELGAPGAGPAVAILEHALKAKEPSHDVYGSCLRALGKIADTKKSTLDTLTDLLKHRMDDVVGKAAQAMQGYKEAPGKVRRELLEELIKNTEGVASQANDAKNATQVRKWNIIQTAVMGAVNALSGQKFSKMTEARAWFNEHKKDKIWDS
jgi:hypothetical protein